MTTINIDGRALTRFAVAVAASLIVGAVGFFVGQTTRMSDTAVAGVKSEATADAVKATKAEDAIALHDKLAAAKTVAARHERKAVGKVRRVTRRNERKRAARLAEKARTDGVSAGYNSGFGAGNSTGHEAGVQDGIEEATDEVTCSDDPDAPLPYCNDY